MLKHNCIHMFNLVQVTANKLLLTFHACSHVACDGTFFPALQKEMSAVASCFNERTQKLLELHLASGFRKYFMWFRSNMQQNHGVLIQEGRELVTYAIINSVAMRKILKKYDKVCHFD